MDIKDFQTVDNLPALYHEESELVVISDLHLGLEGSMTEKGSYVPPTQLKDTLKELETLKSETGAEKLLVNGDIKNEFSSSKYSERKEIKNFLDKATELFDELILIEGNHDTFLSSTLEKYGLRFLKYYIENGVLYTHGDRSLEELEVKEDYNTTVIGHEHPALRLEDEIGITEKIDCFLYGETDERKDIIVMPAFSQISNGTNINETPSSELLSPIIRNDLKLTDLKAIGVDREAGLFEFPELKRL